MTPEEFKRQERAERACGIIFLTLCGISVIAGFGLMAGIVYAVVHFLHKVW